MSNRIVLYAINLCSQVVDNLKNCELWLKCKAYFTINKYNNYNYNVITI
jgi:hypothetical protein